MAITDNVGYLFQHTAGSLGRQSDQMLQELLGIGFSQFKIMMVLQWNPHVKQRDIADSLGQTEASISRQIKLMFEDGLLRTNVNSANRREHITTLTAKGERIADEANNILNRYYAPIFDGLSDKQQRQLAEALSLMHREICQGERVGRCYQSYSSD